MSQKTGQNNAYEKLTPQRKMLYDMLLKHLESNGGVWEQGWIGLGVPISAVTNKRYHGINSFYLSLIAMDRGYTDTRWATYHQIEENGWQFKKDEEGRNLGKNASATVEFYELRDRATNKPFDRTVLEGMTKDEEREYIEQNVYPLRKYYRVFNGDVIDGIPEQEKREINPSERVERVEKLLGYWSDNEATIVYGGDEASYNQVKDRIKSPQPDCFKNIHEFYGTVLHEIGHSTGHEKRLNRDLSGRFGSENYAIEELRAELSAMFLEQDMEIAVSEKHIENNSLYIKSWLSRIKEDPNVLFTAIADADKISRFVIAKEKEYALLENSEPYAIVEDTNELGDKVYGVRMTSGYGQTMLVLPCAFMDKNELLVELDKVKCLSMWTGKDFYEVSYEKLQEISEERANVEERKADREDRPMYAPPSEIATRASAQSKPVDMSTRGMNSLTRLSDIDVVERAKHTSGGEMFDKLYNGRTIFGDEEKDERALMMRIAMFCNGDEEQLMRVFQSSGQFRDEKPNAVYEKMAKQSIQHIMRLKGKTASPERDYSGKTHFKEEKI